jgi:predicted AAA+ superfamily ATPase
MNSVQTRLALRLADSLAGPIPAGTRRRVQGTVALPGKATAVIGMRRAGKTTFLHQLRRERLESGIVRERLPYINFEDEQLIDIESKDLAVLLEEYYRRFPALRATTTVTWCLDEIQTVPGWERFVRRMLDSERVEVFLSGSSAALLSREIATAMRGRAWEVVIHPFSLEEYLWHHGQTVPDDPTFLGAEGRSALEHSFLEFLSTGGFPEVQGLDSADRGLLLHDYVDVAILRDVVERHAVRNVVALRSLVRQLLGNAASPFSVEKCFNFMKSQGISVSKDTVHQLVGYLEDCFLVRTVWMESTSERQRMVNPRKVYPIDTGLIPVFDRSGRANTGHALETAILLELQRRRAEVTYVRTADGREVDFLARSPAGITELIQVCADVSDKHVLEREVGALDMASRQHPRAVKRLLTLTGDTIRSDLPDDVSVQPAYAWLLGR